MKFSVGYQLRQDDLFVSTVKEYAEKIGEVYFSFEDLPNGRNIISLTGMNKYTAREKQEFELTELSKTGVSFNLLLNGNCYGKEALSRAFFCKIGDTIEYLQEKYGLKCVTTTSPLIAKFVKQNFPDIEVRASVNIGIENIAGMDYIAEYFDSFYLKREYNRNIKELKAAKKWCDINGKKLYGLANSGCLNYCSAHTFHDNLVAHESEISQMDNAYEFEGQCHLYLGNAEKREKWIAISNFIRPEDTYLYEEYFEGLKLATRVNSNPKRVISAYCRGSFSGAITDLLEPNHSGLFYPQIIENKRIPVDFAETVMSCNKNCAECSYCSSVQRTATVALEDL